MSARVDLQWIPLGAGPGGLLVRWCGRIYETAAAALGKRPRLALLHSALIVQIDDSRTVIEMAPVWARRGDRGVVVEGPVGARFLGHSRLFRYEVRRWRGGSIADLADAVGTVSLTHDPAVAARVLELVPLFPARTWGRDERATGDMWNSNSLTSWLLARAGLEMGAIGPPSGCRAPGWEAGVIAASGVAEPGCRQVGEP